MNHASTALQTRNDDESSQFRHRVYRLLDTNQEGDRASRIADICLITLISCSVVAVVLESIPAVEKRFSDIFYWFEVLTVSVFSVEYVMRVWSCVDSPELSADAPFRSRLRFVFSFHAIVDLIAIIPFYLLMFGSFGSIDMRFLRAFRLLRVLKLTRYSSSLDTLVTTMVENSRALAAAFLILVTVMLLAASGMYYFERESQPIAFGSIPAAMWWAFSTLTTVGYGDVTPITAGGRIFGALITVVGIGMVALPTSILASGYNQQLQMRTRKYQERANEALDDGVLSEDEITDLEKLRVDLGLGKDTASQILDAGMVSAALQREQILNSTARCPHCGHGL